MSHGIIFFKDFNEMIGKKYLVPGEHLIHARVLPSLSGSRAQRPGLTQEMLLKVLGMSLKSLMRSGPLCFYRLFSLCVFGDNA